MSLYTETDVDLYNARRKYERSVNKMKRKTKVKYRHEYHSALKVTFTMIGQHTKKKTKQYLNNRYIFFLSSLSFISIERLCLMKIIVQIHLLQSTIKTKILFIRQLTKKSVPAGISTTLR